MLSARCTEGLLHLVDGRDENEGWIEICSNGVWGTIYAGNWDFYDASVVCRQLRYQQYSSESSHGYKMLASSPGSLIIFNAHEIGEPGDEANIILCYNTVCTPS